MTVAFCHSGARRKVPTYLFLSLCFSVWEPNVPSARPSARPSVRGPVRRNFFPILDCEPVLERSQQYLEVLFLFFRSFYFLRYFFDILGVLKLFLNPKSENPLYLSSRHKIRYVLPL